MSFKPFNDMTSADYAAVGFRSGLEIHQQLLTTRKLFCRCPAGRYSDSFNAEILRHMRPTLSELGEYDGTALMEFKTRKEIIYRINHETVCTYEMDDTPPFELNGDALDIAMRIAMLYGCTMVDEIHIARKQYLDGSIPTGFQRTTIVGVDGSIPFRGRTIRIVQLGLEEDACREVSDVGHRRIYLTDRLGMPLIETVTAPDMTTPQEVADVADTLRRLVQSTGRVRTGAGAARQDVNVSVTGGTRIEIKGVPRIPLIPLLTYHEAMRQYNLLKLRDELHQRGITQETFEAKTADVTKALRKTRYEPIHLSVAQGHTVFCVMLRGFRGLLRWQTQTDTFFSREISDRVRVIACLTTLPNIIHSDAPSETLSSSEWQVLKKGVGAGEGDTVVAVWGPLQDATTGAAEVVIRAREATVGVPSETRQALRDGTNGFERILPGPNRMYPDTDLPPRAITAEHRERIRADLPLPSWEFEEKYAALGVPADLLLPLTTSPYRALFERAAGEWTLPPIPLAVLLVQLPKRLRRETGFAGEIPVDAMSELLLAFKEGACVREAFFPLLRQIAAGVPFTRALLPPRCSEQELVPLIAESSRVVGDMTLHNPEQATTVLMAAVMGKVRGRIDGSTVAKALHLVPKRGRP